MDFFFHAWKSISMYGKNSMHGKKLHGNLLSDLLMSLECSKFALNVSEMAVLGFLDYQLLYGPWQNPIAEC